MGGEEQPHPISVGDDFDRRLGELLVSRGKLRESDFDRAERLLRESGNDEPLSLILNKLGMVSEYELAQAQAQLLELPLATGSDYPITLSGHALPKGFLYEHQVVPLGSEEGRLAVAMAEPENRFVRHALEVATGCQLEPWVGTPGDIQQTLNRLFGEGEGDKGASGDEAAAADEADVQALRDLASEAPVIRLVSLIIQRAIEAEASDIHIEPFDNTLKVRYRTDGVLHYAEAPPAHLAAAVISRIKIMARLDIAERRLPQDGRIRLQVQGMELDVRVSTVPTLHGESVVMRLLNRDRVQLDLEGLGFSPSALGRLSDSLELPHGMLVVTGPTGSGKTTTLYAALQRLNTESRKLLTVEDPVEYQLEGVNQIQVKHAIGLTFANTLRAMVRQDPDVIMVGEVRDGETAAICVQSALTGHLVLSTLHTNSASASVARLLEMGVEDYLLVSTITAVVGQRLVRRLCPDCRIPYVASGQLLAESGLGSIAVEPSTTVYRAGGCPSCGGTGYRGRSVIAEVMVMDEALREQVMARAGAVELERTARARGMQTMYEDGLHKVLAGDTSLEEVARVTRES